MVENQYLLTSVRGGLNLNVLKKSAAWNSCLPVEAAVCESTPTPRIWVSPRLVSAEALRDGQSLLGFHCFWVASVQIRVEFNRTKIKMSMEDVSVVNDKMLMLFRSLKKIPYH